MLGLDTNVVVRWLAEDDEPAQTEAVRRLFDDTTDILRLDPVVLAEAAWVLASRYRQPRAAVAAALRAVAAHPRVRVGSMEAVIEAIDAYESGGAGFSDHLIGALNASAGCRTTLTFDKAAAKGPHFTLIP